MRRARLISAVAATRRAAGLETRRASRWVISAVAAAIAVAALVAGAVLHAGLSDLVNQARERVGTALLVGDLLVEPGKDVTLTASLKTGVQFQGVEGKRLQFHLGETLLGEVRTNRTGDAAVRWKVPDKPGDYTVRVRVHPDDQPPQAVHDVQLVVAARPKTVSIIVVDLDKTIVASGFLSVLMGEAKPMPGAAIVLARAAKTHTVVYLTHRPDFLGGLSKQWLAENGFPTGPVLTSTITTLLAGSGTYKTARLVDIKKTYANLVAGIGDKSSDAKAYADNGLQPIMILQVDWADDDPEHFVKLADELAALPDPVQVVTNWSQVADILFAKKTFARQDMVKRLRDAAQELRKQGKH